MTSKRAWSGTRSASLPRLPHPYAQRAPKIGEVVDGRESSPAFGRALLFRSALAPPQLRPPSASSLQQFCTLSSRCLFDDSRGEQARPDAAASCRHQPKSVGATLLLLCPLVQSEPRSCRTRSWSDSKGRDPIAAWCDTRGARFACRCDAHAPEHPWAPKAAIPWGPGSGTTPPPSNMAGEQVPDIATLVVALGTADEA